MKNAVLIISLVLNAVLIVTLTWGRAKLGEAVVKQGIVSAQGAANQSKGYLSILESERDDKIDHLVKRLKEDIKYAEETRETIESLHNVKEKAQPTHAPQPAARSR